MTASQSWILDGPASYESIVRHSVFLANAAPVASEQAAMDFLSSVCVPDATHNCWAFRIGARFRVFDDGEPSGTAGRPILSAIDGQNFDNIIIVVTRWFGGIKLGAGGLVRAYGGAASACLREAPRTLYIERVTALFHCPFPVFSEIEARLVQWQVEILSCEFGAEGADMRLAIPLKERVSVANWLRDMTRGQHIPAFIDPVC